MGFRGRATFILELIPVDAYVDEAQDASDQHGTSGSNVSNVAPWSTFSSSNMIVMVKCPPLLAIRLERRGTPSTLAMKERCTSALDLSLKI